MARRDDRPQPQSPGQWTYYRGRWWRFTGTSWVESGEPVEDEGAADAPQMRLRYHRDGAGVYWLQHPRTGAWHRHEGGAWVPSDTPPRDLDPEPLAPAQVVVETKQASAKRTAPRPARLIILVSVAVLVAVVVVLLVAGGGRSKGGAPPPPASTPTTMVVHAPTTLPSTVPPIGATTVPTSTPSTVPPTTTTPVTGLGIVRLRASGLGYGHTPQFTVGGPWDLYYSFNCGNEGIGSTDNFIIDVNGYGAAAHTTDQGVNTLGASQTGHEHYTDSGTFSLTVDTNCRWSVRVVEP